MASSRKRWKKVLYEDQGVPDNYTDETFLDELRKNLNIRTYNFGTVVIESGVVTQQISSICLFIVLFIYMKQKVLTPELTISVSTAVTLLGYIVYRTLTNQSENGQTARSTWDDLKTMLIFLAAGFGLSPVLMTLTETISTDTIYAMTVFMLLANLLFHDYGTNAAMVSQALSLNAAIFSSVCLASRLPTMWHAFATVTVAMEIFALWPVLRRKLKAFVPSSQIVMTVLLGISAVAAIASVSSVGAILFTMLHLFISFICPAWLIKMQPFKNNIYGPWDEAVIKE